MVNVSVLPRYIVHHGDSITDTSGLCGLTNSVDDYRRLYWMSRQDLGLRSGSTPINRVGKDIALNLGVGGKQLFDNSATINQGALAPSIWTADSTKAERFRPKGYQAFVTLLWGANDLVLFPGEPPPIRTATQITNDTVTICANWSALGYIVVLGTPICRANVTEQAEMRTVRDNLLAMHTARTIASDVICDFGASSHFDQNTDILNDPENIFQDTVHPNQAGVAIMAQMWVDAINYWEVHGTPS
jgi:lysophospholipase L1-like esterase